MLELDETTRRALSQRYGPPPQAQARVLVALRATLGGTPGPTGGEGAPTPSVGPGQLGWAAKIFAATASLTASGLLVLELVGAPAPAPAPAREPTRPAASKREVPTPTPLASPIKDSSAHPTDSEKPEPQAQLPAVNVAPNPHAPKRPANPPSSLAAEIALLESAKRIAKSDPEAALMRLQEHRREFPNGTLAPEREALRTQIAQLVPAAQTISCALDGALECSGTDFDESGD